MKKTRLDILLVEMGFANSREKARSVILAGDVFVDGIREDKPGSTFDAHASITLKKSPCPYVSRGGLKLKKAIDVFGINLQDVLAMDVGASTGGFTHCMLEHGAKQVIAIDVGYGQLAWELRNDPRVVSMERTNIRYVTSSNLPYQPQFVSVDVSFISLKKVLPVILKLVADQARIVCLIKPQFEAGRHLVGKKGVVRDRDTHFQVLKDLTTFLKDQELFIEGLDFSPVKGPEGNLEFLIACNNYKNYDITMNDTTMIHVLDRAYEEILKK